ncbi:MAG: hypothetical protein ABIY50_08340 [Ignavibacteria bacterium]
MKYKFFLFVASLIINLSFISSEIFSKSNVCDNQTSIKVSSQKFENRYVRVLVNGVWWMYVYSGPGGTVLIDRYKIEE